MKPKKSLLILVTAAIGFTPLPCWAQNAGAIGQQAKAILQANCAECHGGGKAAKGGFGFVLDRDQLINRLLVTPGHPNQSDLFLRIQQGEMPPPKAKKRPSAAELKILQNWIEAGAPAFDVDAKATKVLSPTETTDAILADLKTLDVRKRRFTRYLTLSHLAMAGRSTSDLDTMREASGKLLNSLSWHPRLTRPEPVDADGTILRLDLRQYKWTPALWDKLVAAYPYRLQSVAESKALAAFTGTEAPAFRADWFVANASRPPFYHDLLQLPTSDRGLERLLQVEVAQDIQDDNIMRSGFNDSGVSKNNRLIERHDAAYGTFWRSYDFANKTGRQNIFEHPVGPNAGAVSFQPAGGEMIFHLPSGLQAYMLVDGKGKRIDKGPTEIVADPRRPDQRVETGISCMSCHARGLLFKADQIRGHVEKNAQVFGKSIVDTVLATHPRKARLQAQIEEDNVRYLKALEKFGVRDPDQEPVNLVTLRFEATLDGRTAAAELGLTLEQFGSFLAANPDQKRIFGSLLVKGGTTQRNAFQENFPELGRRLLAYLETQAAKSRPKTERPFEGHTATVNAITFSNDGKRIATGSDDRTVRVWEAPTGNILASFDTGAEAYAVAFSTDGKFLLSAGRDRTLRLWDLDQNKLVRTIKGPTGSIRAVAFSPNGKRAVSGGDDRSLRIFDLSTGEEKASLDGHLDSITAVAWSKKGQKILSASRDGTARWWDIRTAKQIHSLEGHVGPVLSIALAPDGKSALSGGNDKSIRHWDLINGKLLHTLNDNKTVVIRVQFHPSELEFFSSGSQHRTNETVWRRWSLNNYKELSATKSSFEDSFAVAAFAPDGRSVIVGGPAGFLRLVPLNPNP